MEVFVTNRSNKELVDGYAGISYEFKKEVPVKIPVVVAKHIFGYLEENKESHLARLGWIKTHNDLEEGLKLLEKFEITEREPRNVHSLSPVVEQVPFPSKGRGKFQSSAL